MAVSEKTLSILKKASEAIYARTFYAQYPELPKFYDEQGEAKGKDYFGKMLNNDFSELLQAKSGEWVGEEVSPYLQVGLGIKYPKYKTAEIMAYMDKAQASWRKTDAETRAEILVECLEQIKNRFFDIAVATVHTTGQSYMMSFQASGPHANDRALEAIAMGYDELKRFPEKTKWTKPMGKFDLNIDKEWKFLPKGPGLVIGCSTFPVWNTVPGLFANLITGNASIVKPHAKAVLPIAIVVAEIQKVLVSKGFDANIAFLACDTTALPQTKELAEHPGVKLIDYTGNTSFGNYIEGLGKTTFTEKAGVNSIIIDSAKDLKAVMQNIAFSASLYSGQMCTAPQNVFVPANGVKTDAGVIAFDDVVAALTGSIKDLVNHPKAGPGTLGAIQSDATYSRVQNAQGGSAAVALGSSGIKNEEFEHARIATPAVIVTDAGQKTVYQQECFGPVVYVVKTKDTQESVAMAKEIALTHGSISCGAYCTDNDLCAFIADEMNNAYTPVSFNYTGAAFINQNAAFSDFHVTGGNPSGNASFVNPEYVVKRFVIVGNRYMA